MDRPDQPQTQRSRCPTGYTIVVRLPQVDYQVVLLGCHSQAFQVGRDFGVVVKVRLGLSTAVVQNVQNDSLLAVDLW